MNELVCTSQRKNVNLSILFFFNYLQQSSSNISFVHLQNPFLIFKDYAKDF